MAAELTTIDESKDSKSQARINQIRNFIKANNNLESLNKLLFFVTAGVVVYFMICMAIEITKLTRTNQFIKSIEQSTGLSKDRQSAISSAWLDRDPTNVDPELSNRNIFQPAGAEPALSDNPEDAALFALKQYRLAGISNIGEKEDVYAMVENTQTNMTYFLKYGEVVEGLELENISDGKITVKIGGVSVELE